MVPLALQTAWSAHYRRPAVHTRGISDSLGSSSRRIVDIKTQITGDEEVQPSITVIVSESRTSGPCPECHAGLLCNVGESSVMIVAVKTVPAEVCDVEIRPPIVVEVPNDDTISPSIIGYSGLSGDIRKCAVVVVVKERGMRRFFFPVERSDCRTIHEVDVQPAVIVVIQQSDARPFGLQ